MGTGSKSGRGFLGVFVAALSASALTAGVLALVWGVPREGGHVDGVGTRVSSSVRPSPADSVPRCLFVCSDLLRAENTFPRVMTVKSSCDRTKRGKPFCPASHPELRRKHGHTSLVKGPGKMHYMWVEERHCCKR